MTKIYNLPSCEELDPSKLMLVDARGTLPSGYHVTGGLGILPSSTICAVLLLCDECCRDIVNCK